MMSRCIAFLIPILLFGCPSNSKNAAEKLDDEPAKSETRSIELNGVTFGMSQHQILEHLPQTECRPKIKHSRTKLENKAKNDFEVAKFLETMPIDSTNCSAKGVAFEGRSANLVMMLMDGSLQGIMAVENSGSVESYEFWRNDHEQKYGPVTSVTQEEVNLLGLSTAKDHSVWKLDQGTVLVLRNPTDVTIQYMSKSYFDFVSQYTKFN